MGYIRFPIETDPETLIQEVYDYIKTYAPTWEPGNNLDTWIIRALAFKIAENRDLASDVQDDIFRYFGAVLMGIPPQDAVQAVGSTTWTMIDSLGHTIPAGTMVSLTDINNNSYPFYTISDIVIPPGSTVTAAGAVSIRALNPGVDSTGLSGVVTLIDVLDYVASVALVGFTGGGVDAETDADYLNRLVRRLQRLSQRPILPVDFAAAAFDVSTEVDRAVAIDGYNPFHNLLDLQEASMETGVGADWYRNTFGPGAATINTSGAQFASGLKSLIVTCVTTPGTIEIQLDHLMDCIPGSTITFMAFARANTTARSIKVGIEWRNASGTYLSTSYGTAVNDSNSAWTQYTYTVTVPANAVAAYPLINIASPVVGEIHYFDKMQFRHGSGTDWVPGGTAETGNDRTITVAAANASGNPVSSSAKTAIDNFLQANREVNFLVYVMDPRYTIIDVHADIKVAVGYDSTSIVSDVVAAINNYLSPANWGRGSEAHEWVETPKIYYNELIAMVRNVVGVERVADLTVNLHGGTPARVDVPIANPAGLTTPSTITATAV